MEKYIDSALIVNIKLHVAKITNTTTLKLNFMTTGTEIRYICNLQRTLDSDIET